MARPPFPECTLVTRHHQTVMADISRSAVGLERRVAIRTFRMIVQALDEMNHFVQRLGTTSRNGTASSPRFSPYFGQDRQRAAGMAPVE